MTPRQALLLRLLQRHPEGVGLMDLITTTGGTHHSVSYALRALKEAGLIGPSAERGGGVVWTAIEHLDALKAKRAATRAAMAAAAAERAARRELTAHERAMEEAACEEFIRAPVHRVLPQSDWTGREQTRGQSSVFHIGAAA